MAQPESRCWWDARGRHQLKGIKDKTVDPLGSLWRKRQYLDRSSARPLFGALSGLFYFLDKKLFLIQIHHALHFGERSNTV